MYVICKREDHKIHLFAYITNFCQKIAMTVPEGSRKIINYHSHIQIKRLHITRSTWPNLIKLLGAYLGA